MSKETNKNKKPNEVDMRCLLHAAQSLSKDDLSNLAKADEEMYNTLKSKSESGKISHTEKIQLNIINALSLDEFSKIQQISDEIVRKLNRDLNAVGRKRTTTDEDAQEEAKLKLELLLRQAAVAGWDEKKILPIKYGFRAPTDLTKIGKDNSRAAS